MKKNTQLSSLRFFSSPKAFRLCLSLPMLIILTLLSACSEASQNTANQDADKKHIHFLYNFSTRSLDPHIDSSYVPLRAGITETLVKLDEEQLKVVPWLAESWEGDDGVNWVINLREGITFHNGKAMDGPAVKASLERAMNENVAIRNALNIGQIEVEGNQLQITTTRPFPEFISELVNPNVSVIDVTEGDFNTKLTGTGPFRLTSFAPGSKLELERYDAYWDGASKLDFVTFSFNEDANARTLALQSGQVDIVYRPEVESLEVLRAQEGIEVEATSTFRVHQMTMNMERTSMQDVRIRRAVDALINRQQIVDTILLGYGEAAKGPFLPSCRSPLPLSRVQAVKLQRSNI